MEPAVNGQAIEFRPHHFMCTLGFEGKGYSEDFVRNFGDIAARLRAKDGSGDSLAITVVPGSDSICAPCPNRRGTGCATEDKIHALDQGHAAVLGLRAGERLTWHEAKLRIAERMSFEDFDRVCAPCAWKPIGVCLAALDRLKQQTQKETQS
jgi:hypothetical protein